MESLVTAENASIVFWHLTGSRHVEHMSRMNPRLGSPQSMPVNFALALPSSWRAASSRATRSASCP